MSRSPRKPGRRSTGKSKVPTAAESGRNLKIGEAAKMVGVAPFVLRFWETQFSFLKPRHTPSGHRYYLDQDVETLKAVKRLLHKERFTIEGAKKYVRENGLEALLKGDNAERRTAPQAAASGNAEPAGGARSEATLKRTLSDLKRELVQLRDKLD
jgi:DNA-binding transcriptional MerR regulator